MAYVVGFLSEDEERVLASRGWELEPSPRELVPSNPPQNPSRFRMVWVDASMFEIMNDPDWDKGTSGTDSVTSTSEDRHARQREPR